ncbi:MAG: sigma-54 dependent transcriptional regulator [Anaerolineae bacterium]|nr:sigma-54 dependent transcriptional regulator [Anaerolineae bacterium]
MPQSRILIVEDDQNWQEIYRRSLRGANYEITGARKLSTAMILLEEQPFDVVITDLKMLGGNEEFSGFGVLEQAKTINPDVQVIVITGYGSAEHALRAMGSGAYDYITKDKDLRKKLALSVQNALEMRQLRLELLRGEPEDDLEAESDRIIGNSGSMQALFEQIARAAKSEVNVLLRGEGGTGKRLIAQTIHRQSQRKDGSFLVVDCGRLSEAVLESELFGYEPGTLYGEREAQPGKFERAKNGTIFLDGIGDLEMRLQVRLLGTICDHKIERVGGQEAIPVNARIIASTDKDLEAMLAAKQFQRRLFDALNEFVMTVPPLRQRQDGDDIPALAAMFLQRHSNGRSVRFSIEAVELLRRYDFPGNVRELESAVKYALTTTTAEIIQPEHLRPEIRQYQLVKPGIVQPSEPSKDPATIMRVCPLNLSGCSKKEEIMRLYSPRRVFVNVAYNSDYADYEQVIRQTLEKYGLVPVLSKDYLEPVVLLCNICKLIQTCKYGITDISVPGSNVLYELGLMHANGIHCAILKDRRATLSADIQGLLFLEYTNATSLKERLSRWIENQVKEAKMVQVEVVPPVDPPFDERESLKRELAAHQRNLTKLKEQAAIYGAGQTPLHLLNQIEAEEIAIQNVAEKLKENP